MKIHKNGKWGSIVGLLGKIPVPLLCLLRTPFKTNYHVELSISDQSEAFFLNKLIGSNVFRNVPLPANQKRGTHTQIALLVIIKLIIATT